VNIGGIPTNVVRDQPRGAKCLKFPMFANLVPSCEVESQNSEFRVKVRLEC